MQVSKPTENEVIRKELARDKFNEEIEELKEKIRYFELIKNSLLPKEWILLELLYIHGYYYNRTEFDLNPNLYYGKSKYQIFARYRGKPSYLDKIEYKIINTLQ